MAKRIFFSLPNFKLILCLLLLTANLSVNAASIGSVFTEIFTDKEKLFEPVISCGQVLDDSSPFVCDQNFEINYRGDYQIKLTFNFNKQYKENELLTFQRLPLSNDEKTALSKEREFPFKVIYKISYLGDIVVEEQITVGLGPTVWGVFVADLEVPRDLSLNKEYNFQLEIPREPNTNESFYERYMIVSVSFRRLSSILR